jgi:hypothetical protein
MAVAVAGLADIVAPPEVLHIVNDAEADELMV